MNVNIITQYACVYVSAFTHVSIYAREDCATVPRAYVRQYNAGARERTGLNILFGLLGQGGQPCYFDTGINDSTYNAPAAVGV